MQPLRTGLDMCTLAYIVKGMKTPLQTIECRYSSPLHGDKYIEEDLQRELGPDPSYRRVKGVVHTMSPARCS